MPESEPRSEDRRISLVVPAAPCRAVSAKDSGLNRGLDIRVRIGSVRRFDSDQTR